MSDLAIRPTIQNGDHYRDYTHLDLIDHVEPIGPLGLIALPGSLDFVRQVDRELAARRLSYFEQLSAKTHATQLQDSYILAAEAVRFSSGEGKAQINASVRGHDLFIFCDVTNHSITYKMRGLTVPMGADDHFQDLVRMILAATGKANRVNVIMPFLYESRQELRSSRESLDCSYMLQELSHLGVDNIITFDPHDSRVENAIPRKSLESIPVSYRMIQSFLGAHPEISLEGEQAAMVISPDERGMKRAMFYAGILGLPFGTFYRKREPSSDGSSNLKVVDYKFLGDSPEGRDVLIIDDMINSGRTLIETSERLRQMHAKRIFCLAPFPLFVEGLDQLAQAAADGLINHVFCSNLIYRRPELLQCSWYTDVDMSSFCAQLIDAINYNLSIGKLLDQTETIQAIIQNHKQAKRFMTLFDEANTP